LGKIIHTILNIPITGNLCGFYSCENNKKMRKRLAHEQALWYEEELQKEIAKDQMEMKAGLTFACMTLKKLARILAQREVKSTLISGIWCEAK
jgi:uncharacterized membrane protein